MSEHVSPALLAELSDRIASATGLFFPPERRRDLERGLRSAASEFRHRDIETFARWLLSCRLSRPQVEAIGSHFTVGETYFFRDQSVFDALGQLVLPDLKRTRAGEKRLRIWSAGCCSGEEAYSIAIFLDRFLAESPGWHATILGTDINPLALRKASAGVYSDWSFRNAPLWLKRRYFRPATGGGWELESKIKERVTFSFLNLAEDVYPSRNTETDAMDLIFCRNVLIYFSEAQTARVVEKLHGALNDGGWLIIGATEGSENLTSLFVPVALGGTMAYRKQNRTAPQQPQAGGSPHAATLQGWKAQAAESSSTRMCVNSVAQNPAATQNALNQVVHEESSTHSDAWLDVTRSLANSGRLSDALGACDRAIAADKLNPAAHYLRASILQETGQSNAAILSLERTLYLDPHFVLAHLALGNFARNAGQSIQAERHFANALHLVRQQSADSIIPESDGITAHCLAEMIIESLANARDA